jgi:hypothetical protein
VRRKYLALIALGIVLFLAISALLARTFSVDSAERSAITSLVEAEAHGNQTGVVSSIHDCASDPACRTQVAGKVAPLRRSGAVSILEINSSAGFSLKSTLGIARVAWRAGSSLPIVQCVRVKRAGNAITGLHVELLAVTGRVESDADCPTRF